MAKNHYLALFVLILAGLLPSFVQASLDDAIYEKDLQIYLKVRGEGAPLAAVDSQRIRALSYTQSRLLRSFCTLPGITPDEAEKFLQTLPGQKIKFEAAELLDSYSQLREPSRSGYLQLLNMADDLPHPAVEAAKALAQKNTLAANQFFQILEKIPSLPPAGQWALAAVIRNTATPLHAPLVLLERLKQLTEQQQWVLDKIAGDEEYSGHVNEDTITALENLSSSSSYNVTAMLENKILPPDHTMYWLNHFFLLPAKEQEKNIKTFDPKTRQELLRIYETGAVELLHEINRLHDVTDGFGREIGNQRLKQLPPEQLEKLFTRLHPDIKKKYSADFNSALATRAPKSLSYILNLATQESQKALVGELTSSNIYILISQGSRAYTSVFREHLVLLLQQRVATHYGGNFLRFLQETDPQHIYSAEVVTHLARKGQLALFMGTGTRSQLELTKIVADSAFANTFNVLQFSASFNELFTQLGRPSRSYLLDRMIDAIKNEERNKGDLLQLILEHYLSHNNPSEDEKKRIRQVSGERGNIDIERYLQTPFHEWLQDRSLASLSVFHSDDDGYGSYVSNNIALLENGYRPALSENFTQVGLPEEIMQNARAIIAGIGKNPYQAMNQLFYLSSKSPIVVDWKKRVNNILITHSTTMYHGGERQRFLLQRFLDLGYEMYCQRGHSYWLGRQLQIPLATLQKNETYRKKMDDKQRFLSIGSCGSIGAYFKLSELLHGNVDLLATVGTGTTTINNTYNRRLFELAASSPTPFSWKSVGDATRSIFKQKYGEDYMQPDSLPALLQKLKYRKKDNATR